MSLGAGDMDFARELFSDIPDLTTRRMFGGMGGQRGGGMGGMGRGMQDLREALEADFMRRDVPIFVRQIGRASCRERVCLYV